MQCGKCGQDSKGGLRTALPCGHRACWPCLSDGDAPGLCPLCNKAFVLVDESENALRCMWCSECDAEALLGCYEAHPLLPEVRLQRQAAAELAEAFEARAAALLRLAEAVREEERLLRGERRAALRRPPGLAALRGALAAARSHPLLRSAPPGSAADGGLGEATAPTDPAAADTAREDGPLQDAGAAARPAAQCSAPSDAAGARGKSVPSGPEEVSGEQAALPQRAPALPAPPGVQVRALAAVLSDQRWREAGTQAASTASQPDTPPGETAAAPALQPPSAASEPAEDCGPSSPAAAGSVVATPSSKRWAPASGGGGSSKKASKLCRQSSGSSGRQRRLKLSKLTASSRFTVGELSQWGLSAIKPVLPGCAPGREAAAAAAKAGVRRPAQRRKTPDGSAAAKRSGCSKKAGQRGKPRSSASSAAASRGRGPKTPGKRSARAGSAEAAPSDTTFSSPLKSKSRRRLTFVLSETEDSDGSVVSPSPGSSLDKKQGSDAVQTPGREDSLGLVWDSDEEEEEASDPLNGHSLYLPDSDDEMVSDTLDDSVCLTDSDDSSVCYLSRVLRKHEKAPELPELPDPTANLSDELLVGILAMVPSSRTGAELLSLRLVCRRWRALALRPEVWRRRRLHLHAHDPAGVLLLAPALQALTLNLRRCDATKRALRALAEGSCEVRALRLELFVTAESSELVVRALSARRCSLQELRLTAHLGNIKSDPGPVLGAVAALRALRVLRLDGDERLRHRFAAAGLRGLRELAAGPRLDRAVVRSALGAARDSLLRADVRHHDVLSRVSRCRQLSEVTLRVSGQLQLLQALPGLWALHAHCSDPQHLPLLRSFLRAAPHVSRVSVSATDRGADSLVEAVAGPAGPALAAALVLLDIEADVHPFTVSAEDLATCLTRMPNIETLRLAELQPGAWRLGRVMEWLAVRLTAAAVPRLRAVHLHRCGADREPRYLYSWGPRLRRQCPGLRICTSDCEAEASD